VRPACLHAFMCCLTEPRSFVLLWLARRAPMVGVGVGVSTRFEAVTKEALRICTAADLSGLVAHELEFVSCCFWRCDRLAR